MLPEVSHNMLLTGEKLAQMVNLRCSMGSGPVQPNLQGTFDFAESD